MELIGILFNNVFFAPIANLLILVFTLLHQLGVPGALGFAIVALTVFIRLLIWPFTAAQLHSAQKMAAIKPHLDELKQKHKEDKAALQKAQMELYKKHGVNPAAGCLPALVQIPVFIALYQSIIAVFGANGSLASAGLERINAVLYNNWLHLSSAPDANFFGLNLAVRPSSFGSDGVLLLLVPLVTAALTFIQSKMMILPSSQNKGSPKKNGQDKKEGMDEVMTGMQSQMVYFMPLMIGYFAFQFPVGLAIYWNTFTIMGIIQQHQISGWGGMAELIGRLKKLYGRSNQ